MPEVSEKVCDPMPMAEWLEKEEKGECRPCVIAVAVPHYEEVLEQTGYTKEADKVAEALGDEEDPVLRVAQAMDEVKEAVSDEVREQLRAVDCEAQNSKPEGK